MESYFKIKDYLVYLVYNISVIITPYTCIRMLDSDWLIAVIFFTNSGLAL